MCGRYTITVTLDELLSRYEADENAPLSYRPRYNIAPTTAVPVIFNGGTKRHIWDMSWGLDLDNRRNTIIARAESVDYKKTYSEAFVRRRCLVPADGYYEFPLNHDNEKQPVRVVFKDNRIFSFAGIYQVYKQPDGSKISTFAIITTEPNELLKSVHDRMPVILRKEDEDLWLDRAAKPVQLKRLLVPYSAADEMKVYPVSKRVGNVRNDDPSLIGEM